MIDFHNHFLPNVDDGPKTMEDSILMLKHAIHQGITEVVQTVHFQHPKMEGKNVDYTYLKNIVSDVERELKKKNLKIKIHLSSEVFYLPNLVEIAKNPLVTIGNGKYMLIEFSTNIFPTNYENELFKLQSNGVNPILAHPERYRFIQQDLNILGEWINRGYVIQIDAGSILGHFGKKTKEIVFKMIKNGYIHLIGSDAHNIRKRIFCLKEAYELLENKFSLNLVKFLKENSKNIIKGVDVQTICIEDFTRIKSIKFKNKFLKLFT